MEQKYTAKDVIDMAIQSKSKGVDLYLDLARNSENYHVGKLFMELAKDEQKHKHELEHLRESIASEKAEEAYPGEKALYLNALVDTSTFNCDETLKKVLETTISEEEALQAGITFEKDFLLFLHELKLNVLKEAEETIDNLLSEEIKHLGDMFNLKDSLEKGG
ncbi:MAG: hypothetical protein GF408_01600 [Candidatus Omnitrophica bacterium]|nr:hypothetical protein [Candidatus Omnitrophota bacterium]